MESKYIFFYIIVACVVVIFLYLMYNNNKVTIEVEVELEQENYPTMHSACNINAPCGGDLVCDKDRCKKGLDGDCSADNDCQVGLMCDNWICTNKHNDIKDINVDNIAVDKSPIISKIQWKENDVYYF